MPKDTVSEHHASRSASSQKVSKPVIKFLIGFTAGLCAAFFPRLTASLAVANGEANIILFDANYITLSVVFALLVGLIVMILEWRVPREPRATFMMAIGVPALITGSLNTTSGIDTVSSQAKDNQALVEQIQKLANIQTLPAGGIITPLSLNNEGTDRVSKAQHMLAWVEVLGINEAQASTGSDQVPGVVSVGITVDEPLFYIVLEVVASKDEAMQKAKELQASMPTVVAVQSGSRYLILYNRKPMKQSEAVLVTIKLRKGSHLNPKLMPVK